MLSTKSYDSLNSSSVSPGNPTITSVVNAGFGKYFLRSSHFSAYSLLVYLRFIRFNVASHPLCRDRWKCGHIFGSFAIPSANSSVMIPGSKEPRRILSIPSISWTARINSRRWYSLSKSIPYELRWIPVSTTSLYPLSASVRTSSSTSSMERLRTLPRAYGMIQYVQNWLHPSWTLI